MEKRKEIVSVRLPIEINKKFAEHVAKLGLSKNAFILNLILQELKQTEQTQSTTAEV